MKRNFGIFALGVSALLATGTVVFAQSASPSPSPSLFGATFFGNGLVTVKTTDGSANSVGTFGADAQSFGIGTRNDRLYTFDQVENRVREINKITGKFTRSINIGVSGLKGEGDITFRPSDGVGFLVAALNTNSEPVNDFYSFVITDNTDVGTAVRLGSTGVAIDALAFDSSNTLYAIGQANGILYTINQTNGAATPVGALGVDTNSPISGMTFAPDGTLYAAIDDRLHVINKATGAATPVSSDVINFGPYISSVSGLAFATGAGTLGNMSGRLSVGTDEKVGIIGFIIRGTPNKRVLLRGIGPSLPNVSGVLADPVLELFNDKGQSLGRNDDFGSSADKGDIQALGLAPSNAKESAILRTLPAGSYTAILSGANRTTGVGLVEIYDVDAGSGSRLANLSARGFVQSGDNAIIGGLIVSGSSSQRVITRGIGPSLTNFGVPNVLADPNLTVYDVNGTEIKSNDNYKTDPGMADIIAAGLAPTNDLEAATIADLAPGNYTVVVRGAGNSMGVGLVESFNLTGNTAAPTTAQ